MSRIGRAALLVGVLAVAAAAGAGCAASRIHRPEALPHFASMVSTDDGWEVAVFRVPPTAGDTGAPHHGTPVLLAHGTSVNRLEFMTEGSDLAAFLAARGFDVWLFEYRGDRSSRPPDRRSWRRAAWDVDDIAGRDATAVIDHVTGVTGRPRVYWIGHSLGGIVGYVVAQGPRAEALAGLVSIGAPGSFDHPNDVARRVWGLRGLLPGGQLPSRPAARLLRPTLDAAPDAPLLHVLFNDDNIDPVRLRPFVRDGMENTGRGLALQYLRWIEDGRLTSRDGSVDYGAGLAAVTVPALFLAGRVDHVVPPWTVRAAHDAIGSPDRSWVVLGRGWGTRHDYGHGGLVLGDHAVEEVFPIVADWLERRAAAAAAVAPDDPASDQASPGS